MGWEDYDDYIDYSEVDSTPEAPRRTSRKARPFYRESCSDCSGLLVPDVNWRASLVRERIHLCNSCWGARYNERVADTVAQHRVILVGSESTRISRRAVWGRDEGRCRIGLACNFDFVSFDQMQLDHIIPVSLGGCHLWNNVQTSCAPCNQKKNAQVL